MAQALRIDVTGLRELSRALNAADRGLGRQLPKGIRKAVTVVSQEARSRQASMFEHTRAGALVPQSKGMVGYVQSRGSRHKRGDFGALIVTRVLLPARAAKTAETLRAFEDALQDAFKQAGF